MEILEIYTDKEPPVEKEQKRVRILIGSSQFRIQQISKIPSKWWNLILFLIVATFHFVWLVSTQGFTIVNISGDAQDIWKTITTWGTDHVHYSYVLYKGFFALQPYLLLYRIAIVFGLPDSSLIIAFFGLLYAYSSVYGFPAIISHLVGKGEPITTWKRALFAFVFFQLTKYTYAYSELMVDLPSMASFLILIHLAICLPEADRLQNQCTKSYVQFLITGLCVGVCVGFSGQYFLATCCIVVFILIKLFYLFKRSFPQVNKYAGICMMFFIAGVALVISIDKMISSAIAEEVVASGVWYPKGNFWLKRALYLNLQYYQPFWKYIPNNRLIQVVYNVYGEAEANQKFIAAGAGDPYAVWSILDYLSTMLKYPIDFISSWINHLLYIISLDQHHQCVSALSIGYTSVYIVLYSFVTQIKRWKDVFQRNFWIVGGFFSIVIPILVTHIEPRYAISISGFFLSYAICSNILWQLLGCFTQTVSKVIQTKSFSCLKEERIPMGFFLWIVFIMVLFSWYAALMENCRLDVDILFHW
ncbi:MAG: hypothetical protein HFG20_11840 [Anaerotruncus sp.]|nr:hypothetical protein [Anaerotruncus sp.]